MESILTGPLPKPEEDEFVIYRPPLPSHRLENRFSQEKEGVWRPSYSYRHKLEAIQSQLTPAERYREELATSGKQIRLIQRLELRIHRNAEAFTSAAVRIQAVTRGIQGRQRFAAIRDLLQASYELRRLTQEGRERFQAGEYVQVVPLCHRQRQLLSLLVPQDPQHQHHVEKDWQEKLVTSWLVESHCHYILASYEEVIRCAMSAITAAARDPQEEAFRLIACARGRLGRYEEALNGLNEAFTILPESSVALVRLNALLCMACLPPRLENALDSFNDLVSRNAQDLDAVSLPLFLPSSSKLLYDVLRGQLLERAGVFCALQDFSSALRDLQRILAFKPNHVEGRLRRGRLYCCLRDWHRAKIDFDLLLTAKGVVLTEGQANEARAALELIRSKDN
eukprot:gene7439-8226_t